MRAVGIPARTTAALLLLALASSACARLRFSRTNIDEPFDRAAIVAFEPGRTGMQEALDRLGAPNFVWEYAGDGAALAYGNYDEAGWGFSVSYSIDRLAPSASFQWDSTDLDVHGLVLFFDDAYRLVEVKEGHLTDLVAPLRRPPSLPPELLEDEDGG